MENESTKYFVNTVKSQERKMIGKPWKMYKGTNKSQTLIENPSPQYQTYAPAVGLKYKPRNEPPQRRQVVHPWPQHASSCEPWNTPGDYPEFSKPYIKGVCGNSSNPFFKKKIPGYKHPMEVDKCRNNIHSVVFLNISTFQITFMYQCLVHCGRLFCCRRYLVYASGWGILIG